MPEGQIDALAEANAKFHSKINNMRAMLKEIEISTRKLKEEDGPMKWPDNFPGQHGEMIAHSMLAVRAIEDARMRLGKVLQYASDGISIYDKA